MSYASLLLAQSRRLAIMSLPQGLTASKSVGRLRTFGVRMSMSSLLQMAGSRVVAVTPMTAESPKRNCQP